MKQPYNFAYPSIDDLIRKARLNIPRFAFEYLDGGCNEDVNLIKNTNELRDIELKPFYLRPHLEANLSTTIFGIDYAAPFGISPIGLQGLIWPNAPQILAKAAYRHNIPFILSTVSTASIEEISHLTEGKAWFQLYHPADNDIRDKIIHRVQDAGFPVLIILSDVPTFGYRPRDIRNGLAMPPRMTMQNIWQIMGKPHWALKTLYHGKPSFATMQPYMPAGLNMQQLGQFMNKTFSGRLNEEKIAAIRDKWKGKLVIKGIASEEDTEKAIELGLDGIIVSNHGGRQLDAGQSSIQSLLPIVEKFKDKITIMMDSGIRTGPDIARTLAAGAAFSFLGRSFMYAVAALGNEGANHVIANLKIQLKQVMDQIGCSQVADLPSHAVIKK